MPSEKLASGENLLKGELAAAWNILEGSSGDYTDLGIARRFGGSSAAYSLRDIGAMNDRVVKARRDVGETSDPEEDFSANQVQSGALEDWVNGKLESTLPADVDTAESTYSLRKAKADYSGDAVRIRRSSDDVEVNVALDSDDKVSTSSSISVVSGSTSATDLNEFLNETLTVGVAVEGGSGADRPDSFTNATNSSFTATVTGIAGGYFPYKSAAGDAVTVSFDLVLSVGSSPSLNTSLGVSTVATRAAGTAYNSSGSYTFTLNCNASADHIRFADGDDGTFSVTNFRVVSHTHSAFVHTWYDQAGSNDATQATDANQPKIAEGGALLTDGLDFDGVNDYLEADGLSSIYTGTDKAHSSFVVVNSDAATTTQYILGIGSTSISNPLRNTLFHSGGNIGWQVRDDAGTLKTDLSANPYVANQTYLVSTLNSGTTIDFNTNSVINDNGTDADVGASTIDTVHIGTRANSPTGYLNGSIQELVFYASDQSNNRFKIESNINNYYGLYNDANEFSANPTSAQSSVTLSNVSKTGFTATIDATSETKQVAFPFVNNLVSGDDYFVSFNYTTSDSSKTVSVKPFQSAGGSNASNDTISATNTGFYGGTGDASHNGFDVNATATVLIFQTTGTSFNFTVSNLRVSHIARDGFVETWYDQSGNGFDLKSQSADTQPFIVNNGGFTGGVYSPSRLNNSTKQYLEISDPDFDSTNITSSKFGWLAVMANMEENDGSQAGGVILGNTRNTQSYPAGSISLTLSDTNPNGRMFVTNLKTSSTGDFIGAVDNDALFTSETIGTAVVDGSSLSTFLNGTTGSGTFTDLTLTSNVHFKIFQSSDSANNVYYQNAAQGFIKELMFMQGDTIDDIVTIRNEVNNHYNIF